jgi:hypothetical protein
MWLPTPEKIYDIYAFKLIKRALKKKFPWIKDVFVRQEDLDLYTTIFLNFEFDPTEFSKAYGHETKEWIQELIDAGYYIDYSYPNLINDMDYEEYKKVRDGIRSVIRDVTDNPALPNEFKFDNRVIELGTWHINRKPGENPTPYMSI